MGQSAVVDDDVRLTLKGVADDSRCPVDVTCVWEGDAKVSVEVITPSPRAEHELHTSARERPRGEARGLSHHASSSSNPPRAAPLRISPSDYRATLLVVR